MRIMMHRAGTRGCLVLRILRTKKMRARVYPELLIRIGGDGRQIDVSLRVGARSARQSDHHAGLVKRCHRAVARAQTVTSLGETHQLHAAGQA